MASNITPAATVSGSYDVLTEILLHLPCKSLVRFQSMFTDSWSPMYCVRFDQIPITFVGNNRPNLSILSMIIGERVEDYSALLFHMAGRIMAPRLYFKENTYEVVVDLSREEYYKEGELQFKSQDAHQFIETLARV
ncbi:hypothetical protein BUALT_Bualt12G0054400 [Buddleja alternifolia]|uniref:Uncharacterized protein n=1 Tax=Buddleja alternifolia TaxID=168488 RepID=A0AAV6WZB3_9LAMI|nr:hypothetical protein BUALT_Bualt12G0054400 [Buddleja alternifolia]